LSARYVLRFDDLCPTMNWRAWEPVEAMLDEAGIRPVVAVIPDNTDDKFLVEPPNLDFWARARAWQARGWAIGLHGHHHRYLTKDAGMLRRNPGSEFAGLPLAEQREKLRAALAVFDREGLRADAWIAPNHSFDEATLEALRDVGLTVLNDGYSLYPYRDAAGMLWVPQQLWRLLERRWGVWTVCMHPNGWDRRRVDAFARDLRAFRDRIVDLRSIVESYGERRRSGVDIAFDRLRHARRRVGTPR
jgi:predicted deacetylase